MPRLRQTSHPPDIQLLIGVTLLLVFGVIMVYDASVVYAYDVFGGKYHFLLQQLVWVVGGVIAAFVVYKVGYRRLSKLSFAFFSVSLLLLFLTILPRFLPQSLNSIFFDKFIPEVNGARRWLILPGVISLQPSELAKFSFILYLSAWLSGKERKISAFLFLLGGLCGLVLLQPDFGTMVIIAAIGLCVYFVSGAKLLKLIPFGLIIGALGTLFIISSPYRMKRLQTYLNPSAADPLSGGYHIQQVLIAVGSGGPFGLGFGQSRQKYDYLPEVSTDSIFAVVGEEMGFVGSVVVLASFSFLIYKAFAVAREAGDDLGKLIAVGVGSWLAIQSLVNLGAMTALLPLTGIPLPLISYGGSSMIFVMLALGLLLSVSRHTARSSK